MLHTAARIRSQLRLNTLLRNNFLVFVSLGYSALLVGVINIAIARFIGAESFGVFVASQALTGIIFGFANLGVHIPVAREISRSSEKSAEYLGSALAIRMSITLPIVIIVAMFVGVNSGIGSSGVMFLVSLFFALSGLTGLLNASLQALERFDLFFQSTSIYRTISFLITASILYISENLMYVLIGMNLSILVNLFLLLHSFKKAKGRIVLSWNWPLWKKIIKESMPVALTGTTENINARADSVLLSTLIGQATAGFYGAAYNLLLVANLPAYALSLSIFPSLVKYRKKSSFRDFKKFVLFLNVLVGVGGVIFSAILYVASPLMIDLIYGHDYESTKYVFQFLAISLPFLGLTRIAFQALNAVELQAWALKATIAGAFFNIITNIIFIPMFQLKGAAVTTVFTEALVWLVATYGLYREKDAS